MRPRPAVTTSEAAAGARSSRIEEGAKALKTAVSFGTGAYKPDYCALVTNFLPFRTITTGDDVRAQHTSTVLNDLAARVQSLPLKLQ